MLFSNNNSRGLEGGAERAGGVHTSDVARAKLVEQATKPLHIQVQVHSVAHGHTPGTKEVRAGRRLAHGKVGAVCEAPGAVPAQVSL